MLVFTHHAAPPPVAPSDAPYPIEEVRRQARQALEHLDEFQDLTQDAALGIPRGGELSLVPRLEARTAQGLAQVEFNPPLRSFRWLEDIHQEKFQLRAPAGLRGCTARGQLTVYLGALIVAEVNMALRVESSAGPELTEGESSWDFGRPFGKVFASYSHRDSLIVDMVQAIGTSFGHEYLRDQTHLRTGQIWSREIKDMICRADLFQLFWSSNARSSTYVENEWRYALDLGRPGRFVRPVCWERPMPEAPAELAAVQFDMLPSSMPIPKGIKEAFPKPMVKVTGPGLRPTIVEDTPRPRLRPWLLVMVVLVGSLAVLIKSMDGTGTKTTKVLGSDDEATMNYDDDDDEVAALKVKPPPAGMVAVAAGKYTVGCQTGDSYCFDDEKPPFEMKLGAYAIMIKEVTAEQYDECVGAGACPRAGKGAKCNWQRSDRDKHPINCVNLKGAMAYCKKHGWRLPTEWEWEVAARGKKSPDYPWGDQTPSCTRAAMASAEGKGCGKNHTLPVGSRPGDKSWCDVLDMGGNVREWVVSGRKRSNAGEGKAFNRGGSWVMKADQFPTSHTRIVDSVTEKRNDLGFRCAVSL